MIQVCGASEIHEGSRAAGNVSQPAGRGIKTQEEKAVVTEMHEITGRYGAGPRAHPGQNNSDSDEQPDLPPTAPKLLGVHGSEQDASHDHACSNPEASRDNGVEKAAKHRLFHKWRHQNAEAH